MLTRDQVDKITSQIVAETADPSADLWERVRAILRTWTGA